MPNFLLIASGLAVKTLGTSGKNAINSHTFAFIYFRVTIFYLHLRYTRPKRHSSVYFPSGYNHGDTSRQGYMGVHTSPAATDDPGRTRGARQRCGAVISYRVMYAW